MFHCLDRWIYNKASEKHISLNPSVARWGILQIIIGVSLFAFAISISFIALSLSLWSISMIIAIITLVLAVFSIGGAIFVFLYWIHLGNRWAVEGSKDKTASKEDIDQLSNDLSAKFDALISEVKGLRDDLKEYPSDKPNSGI